MAVCSPVGCKGKIDFLFVISRYADMQYRQEQLAVAVPQFIETIQSKFKDFDYHADVGRNARIEQPSMIVREQRRARRSDLCQRVDEVSGRGVLLARCFVGLSTAQRQQCAFGVALTLVDAEFGDLWRMEREALELADREGGQGRDVVNAGREDRAPAAGALPW